jgi:hypothetical protein
MKAVCCQCNKKFETNKGLTFKLKIQILENGVLESYRLGLCPTCREAENGRNTSICGQQRTKQSDNKRKNPIS